MRPGGYIGEDGRYVDVTAVTLWSEDTIPIRGIECWYCYLDPGSDQVVEERQHQGRGS